MTTLTRRDLALLTYIMEGVEEHQHILWLEAEGDFAKSGVARHIVDEFDHFPTDKTDIRDTFIRVTGYHGAEYRLPMHKAMELRGRGSLAFFAERPEGY